MRSRITAGRVVNGGSLLGIFVAGGFGGRPAPRLFLVFFGRPRRCLRT